MVRLNIIVTHRSIYVVHVNLAVVQTQVHHTAHSALSGNTHAHTVC